MNRLVKGVSGFIVFMALFFQAGSLSAKTNDSQNGSTFIFYLENDIFAGTDRYYTNGVKLIWISKDLNEYAEDERLPAWLRRSVEALPTLGGEHPEKNIALSIGQKIFTPKDTSRSDLIIDDRPYAGWTYAGIALHEKTERRLDTIEFDIGIVGPQSYAREVQETVHDWIESEKPQGWDHQLKNEIGLIGVFERKWRLIRLGLGERPVFDCIPHLGGAAGNIHTYANAGGEIRFGYNLPLDFGTALIRPAGDASIPAGNITKTSFGLHFFAGVDGRGVLRNIFLDGNTFADSHDVDKKPFVADIMVGVSVHYHGLKVTYSHVYTTREFEEQEDAQIYGSISVAFTF